MARRRILAALGLVIAAAIFLPPQITRVRLSTDHYVFNDDARQWTVPFFGGALHDDWTSKYYRAITPVGDRVLYSFGGAETLSKALPFALFAATCAFVAMAVFAITGSGAAAAIAVCFLFSTPALMARITGGSARAFAFPILAACAYGLASRRLRVNAIATVAGAAFYPPAGVVAGVTLVLASMRSGNAPRALRMVGITALLSGVLLVPLVISSGAYGRAVSPADVAQFPEAGPAGRYLAADSPPFPNVLEAAYRSLDWGLRPAGPRLVPPALQGGVFARAIVLACAGMGLLFLARRSAAVLRLLALPAASLMLYVAAVWLSPRLFIPTRYVTYPFALLPAICIPAVVFGMVRLEQRGIALAACIALLLLLGGRGAATTGFSVNARPEAGLYERIARMEGVRLVAGWPTGPVQNVPYLSHKPALFTYETHAAFHTAALTVLRARTYAFIDAYFATSPEPLLRLRDQFGVTHLLVDRRHFTETPPGYFAPFEAAIRNTSERMQGRTPEVARHAPVFAFGPYIVIDLRTVH